MSGPSSPPPSAGAAPVPGDAEHDAWLRAALRHAPDADASPPESLRRTILDEARAAAFASAQAARRESTTTGATTTRVTSEQGSVSLVGTIAAFWTWLARPAVAAGFASVMAATLVGIMWWDRPLDETLPSATPPIAATRQASPAAERAVAQPEPIAQIPAKPSALQVPSPSTPSVRPAPAVAPPSEDKRSRADLDRSPAFKRPADAAPPATANAIASVDAVPVPNAAAAGAATVQPFPAITPTATPAPLAKAAPARPAARTSAPELARDEPRSAGSISDALGRAPPTPALLAARPESRSRTVMRASVPEASASRPLADVIGSITSEPARWSVRRANGERVALDDALRAWLARVDATTGWSPSPSVAESMSDDKAATADAAGTAATLSLLRDEQLDTIVRVGPGRVVVERYDRPARTSTAASLSAEDADALAASLPVGAR